MVTDSSTIPKQEDQNYEKEERETIDGPKVVLTCKSCRAEGTADGGVDHYDNCEVDSQSSTRGLYGKYEVSEDGNPVGECFVLEPDSDHAAREAIRAYAAATENEDLADDLDEWMDQLEADDGN
mgnify:FL=1